MSKKTIPKNKEIHYFFMHEIDEKQLNKKYMPKKLTVTEYDQLIRFTKTKHFFFFFAYNFKAENRLFLY